jgi:anti-anti-sigma factor
VSNFSLSSKAAEDVAVMLPKGYINEVGAECLEHTSEQFLGTGLKKLVVNFSGVQYINTIGISIFTGMVQKTLEHHSMLCFTNMKKVHRDMFELVGLIKHVRVFKDEKDALRYLNSRM